MARIKDILALPGPDSLLDRLLTQSELNSGKRHGNLALWFYESKRRWFVIQSNADEALRARCKRSYLMAWFANKPFSDLYYLLEACIKREDW